MPESSAPVLAVVMATRNRLATLRPALESLVGKIKATHQIVVVELGSTDGTLDYLRGLKGIRTVHGGAPRGQALDLNPVFATVNARFTCWLSDDNVALDGMLDLAVSILDGHPEIGMVGLKVKDVTGPKQAEPYIGAIWPTGVLNCNQGVIRTSLFRQIGFFDEQYQTYGVDPDVTTQVLLAGFKVVYTRRVAIHHYRDHAASPGAIQSQERVQHRRAAHEIYERKFQALIRRRPAWQRLLYGAFWRVIVRPAYAAAQWMSVPLESWLGYSQRDWANLLYTQHISIFDFVSNRGKPYYLVQSLPPSRRLAQAQSSGPDAGRRPHPQPTGRQAHGRQLETGRK